MKTKQKLGRRTFVAEILVKVAPQIGASVTLEPEYGFVGEIIYRNGTRVLFRDRSFNVNPAGSAEIARDKAYTDYFLRRAGYSVPEGEAFFSKRLNARLWRPRTLADGLHYARTLGWPVILKPNNLSQGALVTKVWNTRQYYETARAILKRVDVLVVQRCCEGRDYRIVVLDDQVISAYERVPLSVTGNGRDSIRVLLKRKQVHFARIGRDTVLDLRDPRMLEKLARNRRHLGSVIPKGERVMLLDNANLSTGGDCVDVTDQLGEAYSTLACAIAKTLGLRLSGVDLLIEGAISGPVNQYVVIEVNSAPGLDNYAASGKRQMQNVEKLYLSVIRALETEPARRRRRLL